MQNKKTVVTITMVFVRIFFFLIPANLYDFMYNCYLASSITLRQGSFPILFLLVSLVFVLITQMFVLDELHKYLLKVVDSQEIQIK